MKATEQYFLEVVHYAAQGGSIIRLSLSMKSCSVTIQMKVSEQYFPVTMLTV